MNRKDKIKLLKDLGRGVVSLDDLKPKELKIYVGIGETKRYINGKEVGPEEFTREAEKQLKEYKAKGYQMPVRVKIVEYGDED